MNATRTVLRKIIAERKRQEKLCRDGKFSFTCASPDISEMAKLPILVEEVGEVAKEVTEAESLYRLQTELIQVAAVAVAWASALQEGFDL